MNEIYKIITQIPRGKVATYGQIATIAGIKSPRYVGHILHINPDPEKYPCHRVVNSLGMVAKNYAFGGDSEQRIKLEGEGIIFVNNKIDLDIYLWNP